MKPIPVTLALCVALSAAAFAQKPKPSATPTPAPAPMVVVRDVSPEAAAKLIAERKDIIVVDVRTVEEYDMGHIAGAKNISLIDREFDELLKEIEGKPVLVHCASGVRSLRAVQVLKAGGKFPEIYHLYSGIVGWQEAGKTVVKTAGPRK